MEPTEQSTSQKDIVSGEAAQVLLSTHVKCAHRGGQLQISYHGDIRIAICGSKM